MCRIEFRRENGRLVVHVAGRLTEAQVPDLLEASAKAAEPLLLELNELVSADAAGLDALGRLEERGAELVALPEFLRLKLQVLARDPKR